MKPEDTKRAALARIRGTLETAAADIPKEDEDGEDWYELLLEDIADFCATDAHDFDRPDQPEEDEEDEEEEDDDDD